jgi:hypothetical protein
VKSIFVDRDKLSPRCIGAVLPHRKEPIDLLLSMYGDAPEHINSVFLNVGEISAPMPVGAFDAALCLNKV